MKKTAPSHRLTIERQTLRVLAEVRGGGAWPSKLPGISGADRLEIVRGTYEDTRMASRFKAGC
jgi:hypothetical protein